MVLLLIREYVPMNFQVFTSEISIDQERWQKRTLGRLEPRVVCFAGGSCALLSVNIEILKPVESDDPTDYSPAGMYVADSRTFFFNFWTSQPKIYLPFQTLFGSDCPVESLTERSVCGEAWKMSRPGSSTG